MEAMAIGLPVVATNVGGVSELVVDGVTGHLVPPACPDSIAVAIERATNDGPDAVSITRRAREKICSEFDLRREAARLAALFDDSLRGQGLRRPVRRDEADTRVLQPSTRDQVVERGMTPRRPPAPQ
jgi:glycogen synthase